MHIAHWKCLQFCLWCFLCLFSNFKLFPFQLDEDSCFQKALFEYWSWLKNLSLKSNHSYVYCYFMLTLWNMQHTNLHSLYQKSNLNAHDKQFLQVLFFSHLTQKIVCSFHLQNQFYFHYYFLSSKMFVTACKLYKFLLQSIESASEIAWAINCNSTKYHIIEGFLLE